jgi:hypothetical protein
MNGRYTALPMISMGLRILGYVVLIIGILASLSYLFFGISVPQIAGFNGPGFWATHIVPAYTALVESAIRALLLVGAAELIHVVLDIEENTRREATPSRSYEPPVNELP